jgi:hypothetical protein
MEPGWRGEEGSGAPSPLLRVPRAPRTPSKRARELIFRYQGAQLVVLLVGAIFSVVGVILCAGLCSGLVGELTLSLRGRPATGRVIGTRLNYNVTVNGQHPTLIRFRWDDAGQVRSAESSTRDFDLLAAATVGAEVPIEVAGDWARVRGASYSMMGLWSALFLMFPALGFTLVFFAVRSNRREIRAFTDGQPILARVTYSGYDRSTRINGRSPLQLRWEFKVNGEIYDGSISSMSTLLVEDQMDKKEVVVLYDPMNPRINTIYVE